MGEKILYVRGFVSHKTGTTRGGWTIVINEPGHSYHGRKIEDVLPDEGYIFKRCDSVMLELVETPRRSRVVKSAKPVYK